MIRSLAIWLGVFTLLIIFGAMTSRGQAMLGLRPPQNLVPVTPIQDTLQPAAAPLRADQEQPMKAGAPAKGGTASVNAAPQAQSTARPAPTAPTGRKSAPPQAGPAQGGLAQVTNIANILLNLPQVLDQTQVGPAQGPSSTQGSGSWDDSNPGRSRYKQYRQHGNQEGPSHNND
jgi:hypothetical protein